MPLRSLRARVPSASTRSYRSTTDSRRTLKHAIVSHLAQNIGQTNGRDAFRLPVKRALLWGPVFAEVLISECLRPTSAITTVLWSHLGKLSYSLYLCHRPAINLLYPAFPVIHDPAPAPEVALGLYVLLTMTILYPIVCFLRIAIELPGIRLSEVLI